MTPYFVEYIIKMISQETFNKEKDITTSLINTLLSIKPLANFARSRARKMIIDRANKIGVNWHKNMTTLQGRDWNDDLKQVENPHLKYPDYYLKSFHAYDNGNLGWDAAWELESAAYSVHSTIFSQEPQLSGDRTLRKKYHEVLQQEITKSLENILDSGCGTGLSTFILKEIYPEAQIVGLDLSPYFLAVANYQAQQKNYQINWHHSKAEETTLSPESFDLISSFLMFHELPQDASLNILAESYKLLKKGGYLGIMDMNPQSEVYKKMPRYVLTLLKSTEPYLDQYFSFDIEKELIKIGFSQPKIVPISPRHRVIIAQKH